MNYIPSDIPFVFDYEEDLKYIVEHSTAGEIDTDDYEYAQACALGDLI